MTRPPPSWAELLRLMVHGSGPEPTMTGVLRHWDGDEEEVVSFVTASTDPPPVIPHPHRADRGHDGGSLLRVWRDGALVRIDGLDGTPRLIVGETHCWQFEHGQELPIRSVPGSVRWEFAGNDLLQRRTAEDFAGNDFTRPTGPPVATSYLGRDAWEVELAPPEHKPAPMQVVVDAETGLVLQQRNDAFSMVEGWTELTVGEPISGELFTWAGDFRDADEVWAARRERDDAELAADLTRREEWFRQHVAPLPLRVELDLTVLVHEWHDDGSFEASVGDMFGSLARRPAGSDGQWPRWYGGQDVRRWRDERWEWALTMDHDVLTEQGFLLLKKQLGSA